MPHRKRTAVVRARRILRLRNLLLWVAALPMLQGVACFPDIPAALNFELQSLVNNVLINAVSIVVQNVLGL